MAVAGPLFRRKSVSAIRDDAERVPLARTLGRMDLIVLGIGAVIGGGIFVLSGIVAAEYSGPAVVLALLIAGAVSTIAALCYVEFASLSPGTGSAYACAYATLGELPAWIIGWGLLLEYSLGGALVANGLATYLVAFVRHFGIEPPAGTGLTRSIATLFTVSATAILLRGVRQSAYATAIFVLIKIAVILLFIFFGIPFLDPANWSPFLPVNTGEWGSFGWSGVVRGASILFVAYIGFDAVSTAAQEARDPARDMAAGVLGSLGISAILYAAVAVVLTGLVAYTDLGIGNPVGAAIQATGLQWLGVAVELGAIAGLSSVLLVLVLAQSRVLLAMARDGLLPIHLATVSPKSGVPVIATVATGSLIALLASIFSLHTIAELVNVGTYLAFIIVCVGVPILRRTDPDLPRPFRVPASPFLPLIGALACAYLMTALAPAAWRMAAVYFAVGVVVYAIGFSLRRRENAEFGG